ncbi:glutamyl-tRNA reductase [Halomicroarcula limicola]|uniref:Glutamyl-tRNA reductase n=1 Tax=Haloarcula limicola TaxID=1429915 RepID=A0A8J7Y849_9EURY|nr:glutamyl-tRNA reductase [Halomicroarcula limicola]MBV0925867.1 glutamyl-tRNA reductase [Halomicroarcula limicola]
MTRRSPTAEDEPPRRRDRAETVRDEAVERACSRLRAQGGLSAEQRAAVEELADRLLERLLPVSLALQQ